MEKILTLSGRYSMYIPVEKNESAIPAGIGGISYQRVMPLLEKQKIKFTEAYADYYQVVYGTICSKISNPDDTDDLTQEVFMHFYSRMNEVDNTRAWLFGTINNVLMNYYRKKKKFSSDEDIENYLGDVSLTFVNGFRDTRIIIDEAVGRLTEPERILFDLVAVQNLTYELAGQHLGFSKRQAEYRYSLIVKNIRGFLNEKGITNIEDLL
ncbi:MAG TPA: sigma-70 family RNA polymerase sigma factor [Spirochaetota bacterium]|nr:sigma-70 family RNA polymerase sigma factor [Spirochaetota bacterium]HRT73974.1 sigma-70 family RNA polymerase sigma factor [Spirochaetota bacterium]